MARDPELSIKVKVDPQIDGEKLKNDIQDQVDNVKSFQKLMLMLMLEISANLYLII